MFAALLYRIALPFLVAAGVATAITSFVALVCGFTVLLKALALIIAVIAVTTCLSRPAARDRQRAMLQHSDARVRVHTQQDASD